MKFLIPHFKLLLPPIYYFVIFCTYINVFICFSCFKRLTILSYCYKLLNIFCVVLCIFVLFCVFLCCSMYFCVVLCIVCVYMCTELLPPGGYTIAVKYIVSYHQHLRGIKISIIKNVVAFQKKQSILSSKYETHIRYSQSSFKSCSPYKVITVYWRTYITEHTASQN